MNILMIGSTLPTEHVGGVGVYIFELSKQLIKRGHNVYWISETRTSLTDKFKILEGIKIYRYYSNIRNPFLNYLDGLFQIKKIFNQLSSTIDFDVINIHGAGLIHILKFNHRFREIPLVYSFHSPNSQEILYYYKRQVWELRRWINLVFLTIWTLIYYIKAIVSEYLDLYYANSVIVYSEYNRKQIEKTYGKKFNKKVSVIPIGVDVDRFKPPGNKNLLKRFLHIPVDRFLFFCLRRLTLRMGIENLIKAAYHVVNEYKRDDFFVVIGGKGDLRPKLEKQVHELGLSSFIRFKGFISEEEKVEYYQAADAFIIPSLDLEGFGIVTVEALACGTPVIGTSVGATPEILRNFYGGSLIAKDTSSESIADRMIFFMENFPSFNSEAIKRQAVEKYDWERITYKVVSIYRVKLK